MQGEARVVGLFREVGGDRIFEVLVVDAVVGRRWSVQLTSMPHYPMAEGHYERDDDGTARKLARVYLEDSPTIEGLEDVTDAR